MRRIRCRNAVGPGAQACGIGAILNLLKKKISGPHDVMHRLEAQVAKQPHLQTNLAIGLREIARLEPLVQGLFLALPGLPSLTNSGPERKNRRLLIKHLLISFFLIGLEKLFQPLDRRQ